MRQISGSRDADVSFSEEDREKKLQVPKAELQPVRPPPLTTPYEVTDGPAPSDQATAPRRVLSAPSVARPISPPEAPPPAAPRPLWLGGCALPPSKRRRQLDYKSQQPLGPAPGTGSELGGTLELRLGNACGQSRGRLSRVPMGAGRSPAGSEQKPDSERLREARALGGTGCSLRPAKGAPCTDFRRGERWAAAFAGRTPPAWEASRLLPPTRNRHPGSGLVLTRPLCTCLEV